MRHSIILLLFAAILLSVQAALAQESSPPPIPERSGYLTDKVGRLSASEAQALETSLRQVKEQTGSEIYVLLVDSTKPLEIVAYTHKVAEAWGLKFDATQDRWVFILVAVNDGGINIADSQAVKTILLDAELKLILDQQMKPAFEAGKFADGLAAAIQVIAQRLALPGSQLRQVFNPLGAAQSELLLFALVALLAVGFYFLATRPH